MARYTDESRERVRDAVDFAEVVGARTELRRSGIARLEGLCPFHDERSPSFGINPTEKVYYCFGCGAGGDVFKFVMETENLSFGEALESLAERYRVPLERESEDPREAERRQRRDRLLALLERTAAYYVRVLWESPEAEEARAYLQSRGLEESALRAFRVGYAPDTWDRVVLGSRKAGYGEGELVAAGLASRSSRGTLIDRFRGRVTFPLADERGRVLGFGARAMKPDDKPKYLNTSESELFHKGRIVYGADLARAAAAKAGRVVLVEGYTDVIALHQAGVPEVVAQMGTALTDAQVDAIARLAPKALFCQDPDRAGQESVAKGIAALRTHNKGRSTRAVEFRIVRLPLGEDPADVVQKAGAERMRELLEKAIPIERFEVERALEQPDASTDDMLSAIKPIIASMSATLLRDELVRLVADRFAMRPELVNQLLQAPDTRQPPFTARSRGEMRGRGEPGRGGNPPRAGWTRGGAGQQRPAGGGYAQGGAGPRSGGQGAPGQAGPGQGRNAQPGAGGGQGQNLHPGAGDGPGPNAQPGAGGGQGPNAQSGPGHAYGAQPAAGHRPAPSRPDAAGDPQHAPHGHREGAGGNSAPQPGGGGAATPASRTGSDQQATGSLGAPGTGGAFEDPFVEGPPPLEWDGFSGGEDVDPGAFGSPDEWAEASGVVDPGPAGPSPGAWEQPPPAEWSPQPPAQQQGWQREWQPRGGGRRDQRGGGRGGWRGGGGRDRDRYRRDDPPPEMADPHAAIARRERHEHAFLAFCIALPEEGERRLADFDVDDYFSAPATRRAAAYLRGRLRSPTAHLPAGDENLARVIAKLVVDSGMLEATSAKFELEALQLELHRIERRISNARVSGAAGVSELAVERQRVLNEIRTRLT